jgi:uncharacterized protein YecE (DUF72 family)
LNENLSLFASEEADLKRQLAARLDELAKAQLYLGTSSWKYEGWLGSIYQSERYSSRGRVSKARFQRDCLTEYAEIFHTVCGDFAFYQFPSVSLWKSLFAQIPAGFRFAFKAPEEITAPAFPTHPRYGPKAGQVNPLFLDSNAFRCQFLTLLEAYAPAVGPIIFEFSAAIVSFFGDVISFTDALSRFFDQLPRTFRYAIEIRNKRLFSAEYFCALRNHGVAHVFNSWTEMPSLEEQMAYPDAFTTNFTVSRALVIPGRTYEQSVSLFSPYASVQESNIAARDALRMLLVRSKQRGEPTFIYVNNRLEGFAPGTIAAVIDAFPLST